jgi:NAD(P)-dependent dehydrogenase (short-subunit alcohol dehydrogenase family)
MFDFRGKVALVTGASHKRGFGRAIALRFARQGADVVVNSRHRPPEHFTQEEKSQGWRGLDSVVDEVGTCGVRGLAVTADITDSAQVSEMVDRAVSEFGRIDYLVANAGIMIESPIIDLREEDWRKVLATNLDGVFYCCRAAARHMVERGGGGAIVTIASISGKTGRPNIGAYVASKFGVIGLTQVLAIEMGPHNIRANAVCPGRFLTDMADYEKARALAEEEGIDVMKAASTLHMDAASFTPLGRLGLPEDVAGLVLFLCSDEASFITGQAINVDGGRLTAH